LRVYTDVDEETLEEINQAAENFNISKANFIAKAIDLFLHPPDQNDSDLDQLITEIDQLRSERDQLRSNLDQARSDTEKRWSELSASKLELNQLKRELELLRSKNDQLLIANDQFRSENDQAKIEMQGLRKDLEKYQDALKLKSEHISFLEATVHQTLERLPRALPPSQEEAKAKRWWKFWRRT
jgi:chromosome segregation ATPase